MSLELTELAAAALRGTARSNLPEPGRAPLGQALARVTAPTPESTLLLRAGLAGLHALAGTPLAVAGGEAYPTLPPDARPVPHSLSELLPQVAPHLKVLTELIGFVAAAGQTLGPGDLWALRQSNLPTSLWTVLGERGRWLARQNPDWRGLDPERYSKDVRAQVLRSEILEAHAADPETVAADLFTRWPDFKADERRAVLEAVAASLHHADLPLLALARADKLGDVQKLARQLSAHLPGEAQEAVKAALKASVRVGRSGKVRFAVVDLPDVLGVPDPKAYSDSAAARLIGALPFPVMLAVLDITPVALIRGVADHPAYNLRAELVGTLRGDLNLALARQVFESLDLENWPQSRVRRMVLEAVAAVGPAAPDPDLSHLLASLMSAQSGPLELSQADQARLHRLGEALIADLSAPDASEASQGHALPLLWQLGIHLNPHLPQWTIPERIPPEPLPENAKKDVQDRYNQQLYYQTRVDQVFGSLRELLPLRRRVAEIMGRAP